MLIQVAFYCMDINVVVFFHKWKELTLFQADAQYKALEGEHTPH